MENIKIDKEKRKKINFEELIVTFSDGGNALIQNNWDYIRVSPHLIDFNDVDFKNAKITIIDNNFIVDGLPISTNRDKKPFFENRQVIFNNCNFQHKIIFQHKIPNNLYFISSKINEVRFSSCNAPKSKYNSNDDCIAFKDSSIDKLSINDSTFEIPFVNRSYEDENSTINKLYISGTNFKSHFEISCYTINDFTCSQNNFNNAYFQNLLVNEHNTNSTYFATNIFEGIANFQNSEFFSFAQFTHNIFKSNTNFECIFNKGLLLDNSIFKEDANFFGIKKLDIENAIKNTSQETYRIIKHQFQKIGNNIEANKYHSLELKKQKEKLDNLYKEDKTSHWKEWLVFQLHGLSSEHSSNWFLPLLWIGIVGFMSNFLTNNIWLTFLAIFFMLVSYKTSFTITKRLSILLGIFFLISLFSGTLSNAVQNTYILSSNLSLRGDHVNKISTWFSFITIFNKVSLGYLYYQFLTAIRKDTNK